MQLKDIMSREVDGVRPDTTLAEAVERLKAHEGEPVPVCEEGRLVGLLTDHEIVEWEARGGRDPLATRVGDVMRKDVACSYEDQDVGEAIGTMREKRLEGLVVLRRARRPGEADQPVGIVSLADLAEGLEQIEMTADGRLTRPPAARIFLQPIAAPSILGLYGFAGATFMVATHMAGWYGAPATTPILLAPFAAFFGGLAQFLAGMWAYRARDGLATAMHGMWGAFWMAYGLLFALAAFHVVTIPTAAFPELAYWFIVLAAITWVGGFAALAANGVLTAVLGFLALGSTLAAIGFGFGNGGVTTLAGWSFIISAVLAFYFASGLMLESSYRRIILPLGGYHNALNRPGARPTVALEYPYGQPGVKVGQ
jgi:succinate-acetate transporter protein/CBS domain-containing protein